jgi:hypothetical protein
MVVAEPLTALVRRYEEEADTLDLGENSRESSVELEQPAVCA